MDLSPIFTHSNALGYGPAYDRATDIASHSSGRMPEDNAVRMAAIALNHGLLIPPARINSITLPTREMRLNFLDWEGERS